MHSILKLQTEKIFINNLLIDNLRKLIIDEELKLKRLKTTETSGHRTSIKNENRDNKILEIQKYFAAGRLVSTHIRTHTHLLISFFQKGDLFYTLVLPYLFLHTLILQFFIYLHCLYHVSLLFNNC